MVGTRKDPVSRRARHLSLYLAVLVAGAVAALVVSASAQVAEPPPTASFTAGDNYWRVTGSTATSATIAAGGTVTFGYPSGGNEHDASFTASGPSSCDPPLPSGPEPPGWTATCTFSAPGTYQFICTRHPSMQGTVQVVDAGMPSTPGAPTPPGPGTTPGSPPPGGTSPQPGRPRVSVARRQTGTTLRGSVTTAGRAKIVVSALVSNRALSIRRPKQVKKVKVGSQTKRPVGAAKIRFAVRLNAAARRALNRRERLALEVRIVVTPAGGQATTKTVSVAVRAS
jgi:plastocyanin